jgi:hypothetical protein
MPCRTARSAKLESAKLESGDSVENLGGGETSQADPGVIGHGLSIAFSFCTDTLPHLQVWHDFRFDVSQFLDDQAWRPADGGRSEQEHQYRANLRWARA